jgi:hypothetical protein
LYYKFEEVEPLFEWSSEPDYIDSKRKEKIHNGSEKPEKKLDPNLDQNPKCSQ